MSIEVEEVCKWVKFARVEKGIPQTVMAKKMGYSQPYYSSMELGAKNLDCLKLSSIARITRSSFLITGKSFFWIDTEKTNAIGKKLSERKEGLPVSRYPLSWVNLHEVAKFTKMSFWISKKGIAILNPLETNSTVRKVYK